MDVTERVPRDILVESRDLWAQVTRRHIDMVYSSALRQVGDAHLAEDITQAVLVTLMRKAGTLRSGTVLSAWLLKVTRDCALDALKMRRRREYHEQRAAGLRQEVAQATTASEWELIARVLDGALAKLRTADRDAIVLRYLEEKHPEELAILWNTSNEAARQRVSRALGRLRKVMAQHGIATADAVLSSGLATGFVMAAPDGLVAAIKGGTISAQAGALAHALAAKATATKLAVFATTGAMLLAVGIAEISHTGSGRQAGPVAAVAKNSPVALKALRSFSHPNTAVMAAAVSPDGRFAITGGGLNLRASNTEIRLWDLASGNEIRSFVGHSGRVIAMAFVPGGGQFVSASEDGTIRTWDLATGREVRRLDAGMPVTTMAISSDGKMVLAGMCRGNPDTGGLIPGSTSAPALRLWDLGTGELLPVGDDVYYSVRSVALGAGGGRWAAAFDDGRVVISGGSGEPIEAQATSGDVTCLAFSTDGRFLFGGGRGGNLVTWDAHGGSQISRWLGQDGDINTILTSPDGKWIIAAGGTYSGPPEIRWTNCAVRMWDARTGKPAGVYEGHSTGVYSLSISADGRWLVSAGGQKVCVWELGGDGRIDVER